MGSALRCGPCKRRVANEAVHRYTQAHRAEVNAKAREFARLHSAERCEYKKLWRQANPEKVRGEKRREALRQAPHKLAYHRRYHRPHRDTWPRFEETWTLRGPHGHRCVGCPTVLHGMQKKCAPCRMRTHLAALQQLRAA